MIAMLVRQLLCDRPALAGQCPRLRAEIQRARLGHPSPGMQQCLAGLGRLDVVGQTRQRLAAGLATLERGVTVAFMAPGSAPSLPPQPTAMVRQGTVAAVAPYPLDPDRQAAEPAAHLTTGEAVAWGTCIAVVQRCDGTLVPGPLRWEYAMEHETVSAGTNNTH